MKRRTFIKIGVVSGALGLAGALTVPSFKKTVVKILTKETSNLNIDHSFIAQFIQDANKEQYWLRFSLSKKIMIVGYTYVGFLKAILPFHNKYVRYRGQISGRFLLSTDLFIKKMNVTEPIRYRQFYNPYKQPCANPFSVIFYPETA
jgi:hypothetical protein